ncbi:L-lactate dehydrogenase [Lactobacillus sp. DCY120]|uniref:L-lactate dehydrogenase n=1 Tax=Bombilactobacillus apium TaxID=2675299 RepID=A0A850QYH9_9LACO|nr:L-lactate dehydrogenase [Bombilactobacillus apium]NVY95723.1 L-lactate dehydrogenase [Bombilactobacillus apium]
MNKVGIIGIGHVGATSALIMAQRGHVGEIVLVDKKEAKVKAEQADLQDQIAILDTDTTITVQDYDAESWDQLQDADVIIFSAGQIEALADHGGQRDYELQVTSKIAREIAPKVKASGFNGVIVSITNPCDVIAQILQEEIGLDKSQVVGTGTGLETARMKHAVATATGYNYHDITGYVFGEHGDTMFPVWSSVKVAGQPITDFQLPLDDLTAKIVDGGYLVYRGKAYTNNGIATRANVTAEAILNDSHRAIPVSAYDEAKGLFVGQVAVLGRHGIEKVVPVPLNESEQELFDKSAAAIKANYDKVH